MALMSATNKYISRLIIGICAALFTSIVPEISWALRGPQVESSTIPQPGHTNIEFGHTIRWRPGGNSRVQTENLTLSQGLDRGSQMDFVIPWQVQDSIGNNTSFGDISIMHKVTKIKSSPDGKNNLGGFGAITFPTSSASRKGRNNYQLQGSIILSSVSEHATVALNLGSIVQTHGDELGRYGLVAEYNFDKLGVFGEVLGITDFQNNGKNELVSASAGISFPLSEKLIFDMGGRTGLTKDAPDWGTFAGFTFSI